MSAGDDCEVGDAALRDEAPRDGRAALRGRSDGQRVVREVPQGHEPAGGVRGRRDSAKHHRAGRAGLQHGGLRRQGRESLRGARRSEGGRRHREPDGQSESVELGIAQRGAQQGRKSCVFFNF